MLAFFVVVGLVGMVYFATKLHLESKRNAREHAELRAALDRLADSTDRRFDSTDRKLDQILAHLLRRRSDKDD